MLAFHLQPPTQPGCQQCLYAFPRTWAAHPLLSYKLEVVHACQGSEETDQKHG